MLVKVPKHFFDVILVRGRVIGIDHNVVQVNNHVNV
jgi:hypothetical protein